jgi:signal transduction histidine kinase
MGEPSQATVAPGPNVDRGRTSRPLQPWVAVVVALLVVVGVAGSAAAAASVARNSAQMSLQAFARSSADIASTLQLAIEHEDDLVISADAFVSGNSGVANNQFVQWVGSVQAFTRYPELEDLGNSVIVTNRDLTAFEDAAMDDPAGTLASNGTFQVVPRGKRPYYCLATLAAPRGPAAAFPAGYDLCANKSVGPAALAARDSGRSFYTPITNGRVTSLAVETPIYVDGIVPATVTARLAAFEGWLGMSTMPKVLLDRALQGHPGTAVTFRYHTGASNVAFSSGTALPGARSATIDLDNGWTVETFGTVTSAGIWANWIALELLIAGVVMSVLLALLVLVLATGRARALALVQERTQQLRGAQAQLVDAARQAGMAEIASNVLHNVGNVLNSVNVSANIVAQKVRGSKAAGLPKAVALMRDHADDLGDFLTTDARGKALPGYLAELATALAAERESIEDDLHRLRDGVAHISEIVTAQQSLAGANAVIEPVRITDVVEDALRIAGAADQFGLMVDRDVADAGLVLLDRHRVLLILVNLITNATYAMRVNTDRSPQLTVRAEVTDEPAIRFSVTDNGEGIAAGNLTRIFVHGFTTHAGGHGFGLHSSSLAATEMGGALTVHSDGSGLGARFVLDIPVRREPVRREKVAV